MTEKSRLVGHDIPIQIQGEEEEKKIEEEQEYNGGGGRLR